MITLRLFESENPFLQIDECELEEGELTIGRDPSADWPILHADACLSRKHCVVSYRAQRVSLRDTSTHGTRVGTEKREAPRGEQLEIAIGDTIHLSRYIIVVDAAVAQTPAKPLSESPLCVSMRTQAHRTDATLLEHFCAGADLEMSSFAGEDPAEVMTRLGTLYRQVVNDLCDLMRDRAWVKDQFQMDRTTISSRDNNPLKWAPPHRVAVELLQEDEGGFLKGAEAVRASFADLRRHGSCLVVGSKAAVRHILDQLDPATLEAQAKRQPFALVSKHEAAWKRYRDRHAELNAESTAAAPGSIERALRAGYQEHLALLEKDGRET